VYHLAKRAIDDDRFLRVRLTMSHLSLVLQLDIS
jgi:hypothetical protein